MRNLKWPDVSSVPVIPRQTFQPESSLNQENLKPRKFAGWEAFANITSHFGQEEEADHEEAARMREGNDPRLRSERESWIKCGLGFKTDRKRRHLLSTTSQCQQQLYQTEFDRACTRRDSFLRSDDAK